MACRSCLGDVGRCAFVPARESFEFLSAAMRVSCSCSFGLAWCVALTVWGMRIIAGYLMWWEDSVLTRRRSLYCHCGSMVSRSWLEEKSGERTL